MAADTYYGVRHSPETEGNVHSTLKPMYMRKTGCPPWIFECLIFWSVLGAKNMKNGPILAQKVSPFQNDQYLYTSEHYIKCLRILYL